MTDYINIKGFEGFEFLLDRHNMEVTIYSKDDEDVIDIIDIYEIENVKEEVKNYMIKNILK